MSKKYLPENHGSSHIVFNGDLLTQNICNEIIQFCSTSQVFKPKKDKIFIKIKDIDNIQKSLDILYEGADKLNIKLIPEPTKNDIISLIKHMDKDHNIKLLYKKEDYMCTDKCKQPLDKNISYDDINDTYYFTEKEDYMHTNECEQLMGENISCDNDTVCKFI